MPWPVSPGHLGTERYRRWRAPEEIERRVEPYGLVLKAGRWYPVAGGPSGIRTHRVDQVLEVHTLEEEFAIPDGFDPGAHWNGCLADFRARLHCADRAERGALTAGRGTPAAEHRRPAAAECGRGRQAGAGGRR
ncbi:WYL domain-containing protein [Kitasatospora sp. HPMI-4]|uniref:WYL domain-containing protein n=1 Tax=Kitasatospora sp. HPMI-4 TaxID=3448443 RepID=UPI003F1CA5D6